MRHWRLARMLLAGCLAARAVHASGLPVYDGANDLKTTVTNMLRVAEATRSYGQQVKQFIQDAQSLAEAVRTAQAMAQALEHLPQSGNPLEMMAIIDAQTTTILSRAQAIGFTMDRTAREFTTLYQDAALVSTQAGRAAMLTRMRAARLEMTGVAMQAHSIRTTFVGIADRLTQLLGLKPPGTTAAVEALTRQQVLAQQQQQVALTIHAMQGRLDAMQQAEALLERQLAAQAAQEDTLAWLAYSPTVLGSFNGFLLQPRMGQ